jgi:HSP20 family protein
LPGAHFQEETIMATTSKESSPNKDNTQPRDLSKPNEPKQNEQRERRPEQSGSNDRSLTPYRNWEPMTRVRDEFDRLFDRFTRGWFGMPAPSFNDNWRSWGVDVRESDDEVTVVAEAPGFESGDFDIQVRGDQLVMRAEHQCDKTDKESNRREWCRNEFYHSMPLSTGLDAEKIKANYRNGVLTVSVPKTEAGKPRRIAVEG